MVEGYGINSDEMTTTILCIGETKEENDKGMTKDVLKNQLEIVNDKGQVVFISSNQIITTRTLEGEYPNYSQLIPDNFEKLFIFNTKKASANKPVPRNIAINISLIYPSNLLMMV